MDLASEKAKEFCEKNKGWVRICDLESSDHLYQDWFDLPAKERKAITARYGTDAENAWREFGIKKCKVPNGFINSEGKFYPDMPSIPYGTGLMMIFKIG